MNDRSRQNMLDALDALVEAISYIEQDQDYVVIHKGDVENGDLLAGCRDADRLRHLQMTP